MREASVTKECCKYLKDKGIFHARMNAGNFRVGRRRISARKGLPDFVACHSGRFYGLEFKASKGRPSPEQLEVGEEIEESGGRFLIIRSIDDLREGMGI